MGYIGGVNPANQLRITGMTTGMDTDATVKQMTAAEQLRIDREEQNKQIYTWQQQMYQEIIKNSREFYNKYFEVGSSNSIFSSSNYSTAKVTSENSSIVDAKALPGAKTGTYNVEVTQKAENAKIVGRGLNVSGMISGTVNLNGKNIKINGETIAFGDVSYNNAGEIRDFLNTEINNNTNLKGKIKAVVVSDGTNDYMRFDSITDDEIKIDSTTIDEFKNLQGRVINPTKTTTLEDLGMTDAASITFNIEYTDADGKVKTSQDIILSKDDTIQEAIDKIYGTKSNEVVESSQTYLSKDIEISFSELTKGLTINTRNTGSNQSIEVMNIGFKDSNGNPLGTAPAESKYIKDIFGIGGTEANYAGTGIEDSDGGEDALVKITDPSGNQVSVVKSSNDFTIDGVSYSIKKASPGDVIELKVESNVDEPYNKIKSFIDDYNKIIDNIYEKIEEKKNYNYKPLTAAEKEDMEEKAIEKWEEQAKKGLLKNDTQLQSMVYSLRSAFYETVKNVGINVTDIGLSTSADTTKRGHIEIDETKLKEALKTRGDQIQKLFTNTVPAYSVSILNTEGKFNEADWEGKTLTFKVGSVEKTLTITGGGTTLTKENLEEKINALIKADSDLKDKISVDVDFAFSNDISFIALTKDTVEIKGTTLTNLKDADKLVGMEILNKSANSGIFTKIKDIFRSNTKTYNAGLLKKAGYTGTGNEYDNTLTKFIKQKEDKIKDLYDKLYTKQDYYYKMFANLETYMNQMNAQMSMFSQQMGTS